MICSTPSYIENLSGFFHLSNTEKSRSSACDKVANKALKQSEHRSSISLLLPTRGSAFSCVYFVYIYLTLSPVWPHKATKSVANDESIYIFSLSYWSHERGHTIDLIHGLQPCTRLLRIAAFVSSLKGSLSWFSFFYTRPDYKISKWLHQPHQCLGFYCLQLRLVLALPTLLTAQPSDNFAGRSDKFNSIKHYTEVFYSTLHICNCIFTLCEHTLSLFSLKMQ